MVKKHIVCFGDSNTHGFNPRTLGRYDEDTRWTCLLQKNLGNEYQVIEEGLGGRTTVFEDPLAEGLSGLNYIEPCLKTHKPVDLLVIMLGTNDCKERFNVNALEIGIGLQRLIRKAKSVLCWGEHDPRILVVAPKSIADSYDPLSPVTVMGKGCDRKSKGVAKEFERIAKLEDVYFFNANKILADRNLLDGVHLDEKGHKKLAENLSRIIKEIV